MYASAQCSHLDAPNSPKPLGGRDAFFSMRSCLMGTLESFFLNSRVFFYCLAATYDGFLFSKYGFNVDAASKGNSGSSHSFTILLHHKRSLLEYCSKSSGLQHLDYGHTRRETTIIVSIVPLSLKHLMATWCRAKRLLL